MFRLRDVLVLSAALMVTACDLKEENDQDKNDGLPGTGDDTEDLAEAEYGPENSWWHAYSSDVSEDLEGTGYSEGDIAYNFTLNDQFGDEVELYQFFGQVILLDVYAEW
jgi:hypothetical protein